MPRGCKLGLGPHSAGSCTGKSHWLCLREPTVLQTCHPNVVTRPIWCEGKGWDEGMSGKILFALCTVLWSEQPCCTGQRQGEWAKGRAGWSPVALSVLSKGQAFTLSGWEHLQVQTQGLDHPWGEVTPALSGVALTFTMVCMALLEPALWANARGHTPSYTGVLKIHHLIC